MSRVIIHVDCDCFYAQVEILRLKLPRDTPLCVLQWGYALAVSYPARKFEIKRGDGVADIRKKGGGAVRIVSVDTIGPAGSSAQAADQEDAAHTADLQTDRSLSVQDTEKVSLARYRAASAEVFRTIVAAVGGACSFERASIDECFLDVTALVEKRLSERRRESGFEDGDRDGDAADDIISQTVFLGGESSSMGSCQDGRLLEGARIAARIRSSVAESCGYTLSAGISWNKMLAKFASSQNKPNRQTLILPHALPGLLSETPLTKFRGCGGKLGASIEELGFATAAEVRDGISLETLEERFGGRNGKFVWAACRGIDDSEVIQRQETKSLLAAKNFTPTNDIETAVSWMRLLASELVERLKFEQDFHVRFARTLTLTFRLFCCRTKSMTNVSRANPMPSELSKAREQELVAIARRALVKLLGTGDYGLPISFVGMTGANFASRAEGKSSISRFFAVTRAKRSNGQEHPDACDTQRRQGSSSERSGVTKAEQGLSHDRENVHANQRKQLQPDRRRSSIATFLTRGVPVAPSSSRAESDLAHARRLQEAADLELARRLTRRDSQRDAIVRKRSASANAHDLVSMLSKKRSKSS